MTDLSVTNFHFLKPWFVVLLPFILFITWRLKIALVSSNKWQTLIAPHLQKFMIPEQANTQPHSLNYHQKQIGILLILLLLSLLGPTAWKKTTEGLSVKPQIMVLLDQSTSMLVEDIKPSRHKRATFLIEDILSEIPDAAVGLMAYAGTNHALVPITFAQNIVKQALDNISPKLMPVQGSNASEAIASAQNSLAAHPNSTLIWITDEIRTRDKNEIRKQLAKSDFKTIIIGVGTKQGGPIELSNGQLMRASNGALIVPSYDKKAMAEFAKSAGASFYDQQDLFGMDTKKLVATIDPEQAGAHAGASQKSNFQEWVDLGPWLLFPAALLFASFFRKGFLFAVVILIQPLLAPDLAAKRLDQKAWEAYQNQDFATATHTDDPLIKGAALYQLGDHEGAAKAFANAARIKPEKSQAAIQAYYNLGNALAKTGNLEAALGAYQQVLDWNPEHEDASANQALVQKLKEQQEQKQPSDSDKQNGDKSKQDQDKSQADPEGQPSDEDGSDSSAAAQKALKEALEDFKAQEEAQAQADAEAKAKPDDAKPVEDTAEQAQRQPEENPRLEAIQLQPDAVLRNKMLRQYQLQQQRGPTDDEPW